MSVADQAKWDARYATATVAGELTVDDWWIEKVSALRPGRALDLACGLGHYAVWLAAHGWQVTGVDISPVGLAKAADLAQQHRTTVNWIVADLDTYDLPAGTFDLITVTRFLDRTRLPGLISTALAPGGWLAYQTFCVNQNKDNSDHVCNPAFVLQPGELPRMFPTLLVASHDETVGSTEGYARLFAYRMA